MKLGKIETIVDETVMMHGYIYGNFKDSAYHMICQKNASNFLAWYARGEVVVFTLWFDHEEFAQHALGRLKPYAKMQQKNKLASFAEGIERKIRKEFDHD